MADLGQPAVEVRGLTKWFGDVTALDRVELTVEAGSVHGLVGANGAGKSTLLSVLFGLVRPDEGVVRIFGRTRRDAGASWLDRVGGFVESPRFYPYLTGRANLGVFAGLDGDDSRALIEPVLDLVGLGSAAGQKVKGYSLGMRQRLGLAAAIIRRPALLILDEPTNGLDPAGNRSLRDALRAVSERGTSVLFSSHDIAQVERLSTDVTVLDHGAVVFSGSTEQLRVEAPLLAWQLRTSDDPAAVRLAVTAGMDVDDSGDQVRISADQSALGRYLLELGHAGIDVRSLEQAASALETLVLRLARTDRPPADDGAPSEAPAGRA